MTTLAEDLKAAEADNSPSLVAAIKAAMEKEPVAEEPAAEAQPTVNEEGQA